MKLIMENWRKYNEEEQASLLFIQDTILFEKYDRKLLTEEELYNSLQKQIDEEYTTLMGEQVLEENLKQWFAQKVMPFIYTGIQKIKNLAKRAIVKALVLANGFLKKAKQLFKNNPLFFKITIGLVVILFLTLVPDIMAGIPGLEDIGTAQAQITGIDLDQLSTVVGSLGENAEELKGMAEGGYGFPDAAERLQAYQEAIEQLKQAHESQDMTSYKEVLESLSEQSKTAHQFAEEIVEGMQRVASEPEKSCGDHGCQFPSPEEAARHLEVLASLGRKLLGN